MNHIKPFLEDAKAKYAEQGSHAELSIVNIVIIVRAGS